MDASTVRIVKFSENGGFESENYTYKRRSKLQNVEKWGVPIILICSFGKETFGSTVVYIGY